MKNNDLKERQSGDAGAEDTATLAEGLHSLGIAVLECAADTDSANRDACRIVGKAPDWWSAWLGTADSILERSPFLEDFVSGAAHEFWKSPDAPGPLRSGLWEESPAAVPDATSASLDHSPRFLEATASRTASGKQLLLIEPADERLQREQSYLQSVHDLNLDRRRLQKEIEKKQILLNCITHDLSGPVSTLLNNLEQAAGQLEGQNHVKLTIERAISQAKRQRSLVESISEIFAADMHGLQKPDADVPDPPDLVAVAAEVISACALTASGKSVTLCPFFSSPLPVVGDRLHLSRIIENLLLNGIEHSPEGSAVMIHFEKKDGFAVCRIEDEGPWIDPEDINSIFEPFGKKREGTGKEDLKRKGDLGLYFCHMTATLWGGRIDVWNRPEGGGCFEIWLPISEA